MVHGCNPPKSNLPTHVVMGGSIHSNSTEIRTATVAGSEIPNNHLI